MVEHQPVQYYYRSLGHAYVKSAANIMAQAFLRSESFVEIFRGTESKRLSALQWVFERNIRIAVHKNPHALRGIIIQSASKDDEELVATFMLNDSIQKLSILDYIKAGILWMPFYVGVTSFYRLLQVVITLDPVKQYFSDMNYEAGKSVLLLERMAVKPEFQRKGIGSMCVKAIVEEAEQLKKPLILLTQSVSNVQFYQSLGFEVWTTMLYKPEDEHGYNNSFMQLMSHT